MGDYFAVGIVLAARIEKELFLEWLGKIDEEGPLLNDGKKLLSSKVNVDKYDWREGGKFIHCILKDSAVQNGKVGQFLSRHFKMCGHSNMDLLDAVGKCTTSKEVENVAEQYNDYHFKKLYFEDFTISEDRRGEAGIECRIIRLHSIFKTREKCDMLAPYFDNLIHYLSKDYPIADCITFAMEMYFDSNKDNPI